MPRKSSQSVYGEAHRFIWIMTFVTAWLCPLLSGMAFAQPTDGLIVYFPFENSPNDMKGHAVVPHGSLSYVSSQSYGLGSAMHFNGADTWLELTEPGLLSFNVATQSYTISAWVRINEPSPPRDYDILRNNLGWGDTSFSFGLNGDVNPPLIVESTAYQNGPIVDFQVRAKFGAEFGRAFGTWHHYAVTFDHVSGLKTLYIDGVIAWNGVGSSIASKSQRPLGQTLTPGSLSSIGAGWEVGNYPSTPGIQAFFSGDLDEVRVYGRALGSSEVASLMGSSVSLQWADQVLDETPWALGSLPAQRAIGVADAASASDPAAHAASPGYGGTITLGFSNARIQRRSEEGESDFSVIVAGRNTGAIVQVELTTVTLSCGVSPIAVGEIVDNTNEVRQVTFQVPANAVSQIFDALSFVDVVDPVRNTPPPGSPRVAIDAVYVSPLRPMSPPPNGDVVPLVYPGLQARTPGHRNLCIVTHGWNNLFGSGCDGDPWPDQMALSISDRLVANGTAGDWDVRPYHWEQYAGQFFTYPQIAAARAGEIGRQLGVQIAGMGYEHVHIIAHSAGTWVAEEIAESISGLPISVHLTLLDAYVPLWTKGKLETVIEQDNVFCDNYFDDVGSDLWMLAVATNNPVLAAILRPFDRCEIATEAPFTSAVLNGAYNVDVTQRSGDNTGCVIDPFAVASHSHPYRWYASTIAAPCSGPGSPIAPCDYPLGFGMSKENVGSSWSVATMRSLFPPHPASPLLTLGEGPASVREIATRLDSVIGCGAATWAQGSTGMVGCINDVLNLTTGSPVWVQWPISIDQEVNFVELSYRSTAATGTTGVLSIFWNGVPVYSIREVGTMPSPATVHFTVPTSTGPGTQILTLRVDPDGNAPIQFNVSSIRTGLEQEQICLGFLEHPADITSCRGSSAPFAIVAFGNAITYQWQWLTPDESAWLDVVTGANVDPVSNQVAFQISGGGPNQAELELIVGSSSPKRIRCVASNACGSLTSDAAMLTILDPLDPICTGCPACPADFDNNGGVDGGDLAAFFEDFEAGELCADVDRNGGVDGGDLAAFFVTFEAGGCE